MTKRLKPIPIPAATRWRIFIQSQLPYFVFATSVLLLMLLWQRRSPQIVAVGQVDFQSVPVQSEFGGVLQPLETPLEAFAFVEKNTSVVARLIDLTKNMDLDTAIAERDRLVAQYRAEGEKLRLDQMALDRTHQRDQVGDQSDLQNLKLSLERSVEDARGTVDDVEGQILELQQQLRDLTFQRDRNETAISIATVKIAELQTRVDRLGDQVQLSMAPTYRLAEVNGDLRLQESGLQRALQLRSVLDKQFEEVGAARELAEHRLTESKSRLRDLVIRRDGLSLAAIDSDQILVTARRVVVDQEASLQPLAKAIAVQDALIESLGEQIAANEIRAPTNGIVSAVHYVPGVYVPGGEPILTIASNESTFITAYLNQQSSHRVRVGDEVTILVRSRVARANSRVLEQGGRFQTIPPYMTSNPQVPQLGLPIKIELPKELNLIPGEIVDLVLSKY